MRIALAICLLLCGCSLSGGSVAPSNYDSWPAIMRELDKTGVCRLSPGVHNISQTVKLKSGQRLVGKGKYKTTLRLIDNCPSYTVGEPGGNSYRVVGTVGLSEVDCYVGHMTIDANLGGQVAGNHTNTMHCAVLYGGGHTLEEIKFVGWGCGGQTLKYRENFPSMLVDARSKNLPKGLVNRISRCTYTVPCFDYRNDGDYTGGDASLLVIWNVHGPGIVEGNNFHNIGLSDVPGEGWSPGGNLLGITLYGRNVTARNNTFSRFAGTAFWAGDSWTNSTVVFRNNVCDGVLVGVRLNGGVWDGLEISGNHFRTFGNVPASWRLQSEHPWYWNKQLQTAIVIGGRSRLTNAVIANNTIQLDKWAHGSVNKALYPPVIFSFESTNYNRVAVVNNTIMTDRPTVPGTQAPLSLWYDRKNRVPKKLRLHNNNIVSP